MTREEGEAYLKTVIEENKRHKYYDHVVALAEDYKRFYTGKGLELFIKEIYDIEIPPKQITSIVPPILKSTQYPYNKVFRIKPTMRKVDYEEKNAEERISDLEKYIQTYWGGRSLEEYLQNILVEYNYIDPNAWIVTEFAPFDPKKSKAKPYPFLVLSYEAIDFKIVDGKTEYLTVKQDIDGKARYTLYLDNDTIVFQEVEETNATKINGKYYNVDYFSPKGGVVPAVRVGYKDDIETRGETYVAIFDNVIPFLKKILKVDYEGDISMGDLAFPKRYEYVDDCENIECKNGYLPDGSVCSVCHGSGETQLHKTSSDVRKFVMPRDKDEIIPLNNMSYIAFPPVEGLRFQQEVKDKWKNQTFSFMFNAEIFDKTEVTATATEKNIQMDNLNDAVQPMAKKYERVWEAITKQIATYTDNAKGLILQLVLPNDFKFKTLSERMAELEAARRAGASIPTIAAIEDDINDMLYADRPDELKKIRIKNSLNPFMGYTDENVRVIISQKLTTKSNEVLYSNLESIMNGLELEYQDPWIYDMNITKIKELVDEQVALMIEQMDNEKPEPITNPFQDENTTGIPEAKEA